MIILHIKNPKTNSVLKTINVENYSMHEYMKTIEVYTKAGYTHKLIRMEED